MTNREFFAAIAGNTTLSVDLVEFATTSIAKIDKENEKRRTTLSKDQVANNELCGKIFATFVADKIYLASDVATEFGISTSKASAMLRKLVADGKLHSMDVKIPKKGAVKGYTLG